MAKLGIIGMGRVGSQLLTDVQYLGLFFEIILIDSDQAVVYGEMLDHQHIQGIPDSNHITIKAGEYADLSDADVIVITASIKSTPDMADRAVLAKGNRRLIEEIIGNVAKVTRRAVMILISNPVDAMTYIAAQQYPTDKIIGTGTLLETSRFKTLIADHYQVDPKNVEAFVIGEHGAHAVPVWSRVRIHGMDLAEYEVLTGHEAINQAAVTEQIDQVSFDVFKSKGWTNAAISRAAVYLIRAVLLDQQSILPLTSVSSEYHFTDAAFSLPTLVDKNGIVRRFAIQLSQQEHQQLKAAYDYIKQTVESVS